MSYVEEHFNRVKGAEWFVHALNAPIVVIGAGGIGSWLSLLLGRLGSKLYIFDNDQFEVHNMTGQFITNDYIEHRKSSAVRELVKKFCPSVEIIPKANYTMDSFSNYVVMCGLDNMEARKIAFTRWLQFRSSKHSSEHKKMLFIDGRLNAELIQILTVPGDNEEAIKRYEEKYLFEDSEVVEQECTFKQTSHCAAIIAGMMVTFYTNWLTNTFTGDAYRSVPFFYEFIAPLNMTTNERLPI